MSTVTTQVYDQTQTTNARSEPRFPTPMSPPDSPETEPVAPKRAAWDALKVADHAWSAALTAHLAASSALGRGDRLRHTADAAGICARAARAAAAEGLRYSPMATNAEQDVLVGELHGSTRPSHPDAWTSFSTAERALALAFRTDDLTTIADAFDYFASNAQYLAHAVDVGGS